ncbi:MAG: hypothetical protein KKA73_06785 [Chloroflexi bacterium]|nr:hypothetical protein [Chloroflexota bacterium]MBU1747378.1 hypothetical protein [Chloroflexota bacterium]
MWETREPGVDPEETWASGEHEHSTLEEAVAVAIPGYQELGLSFEQVALVAVAVGLVLSTGAEIGCIECGAAADDAGGYTSCGAGPFCVDCLVEHECAICAGRKPGQQI